MHGGGAPGVGTGLAAALARGHREGTPEGVAEFYDAYADGLFAYCRTLVGDERIAAEAVHDAMVVARARAAVVGDDDLLRALLYAVARTECVRHGGARPDATDLGHVWRPGVVVLGPVRDRGRLLPLVPVALAGVDPAEREALELVVRHGFDEAGAARVLGLSERQTARLVARGREQFAMCLRVHTVSVHPDQECAELAVLLPSGVVSGATLPQPIEAGLRVPAGLHVDSCGLCAPFRPEGLTGDGQGQRPAGTPGGQPPAPGGTAPSGAAPGAIGRYPRHAAHRSVAEAAPGAVGRYPRETPSVNGSQPADRGASGRYPRETPSVNGSHPGDAGPPGALGRYPRETPAANGSRPVDPGVSGGLGRYPRETPSANGSQPVDPGTHASGAVGRYPRTPVAPHSGTGSVPALVSVPGAAGTEVRDVVDALVATGPARPAPLAVRAAVLRTTGSAGASDGHGSVVVARAVRAGRDGFPRARRRRAPLATAAAAGAAAVVLAVALATSGGPVDSGARGDTPVALASPPAPGVGPDGEPGIAGAGGPGAAVEVPPPAPSTDRPAPASSGAAPTGKASASPSSSRKPDAKSPSGARSSGVPGGSATTGTTSGAKGPKVFGAQGIDGDTGGGTAALTVTPSLLLTAGNPSGVLRLTAGDASVSWTLSVSSAPWVTLSRTSGTLRAGAYVSVTVAWDVTRAPVGGPVTVSLAVGPTGQTVVVTGPGRSSGLR